jgi:molybdopterin-containing oxidoreductase family iron-sulfur binding subunit
MRILTGTVTSPMLASQLETILKLYPQAKWHQWEPAVGDGPREGAKLAFGRVVNTVCRLDKANVVVSLEADFMTSGPGHVRYMKDFYRRRNLTGRR